MLILGYISSHVDYLVIAVIHLLMESKYLLHVCTIYIFQFVKAMLILFQSH